MQSTLTTPKTTAKPSDDPHDIVVVAPDAIRVAPSEVAAVDAELSDLLQQAARHRSETPARIAPNFAVSPAIPTVSTVPTVDTTFRSAAANAGPVAGRRGSTVRRTMRSVMTLLVAGCIGVAAFAWRAQGAATKQMIAQWTPQFVQTLFPSDQPGLAVPPAASAVVQADAVSAEPPPVQTAPEAVAPAAAASPESSPLLQSMARDLASLGQEVEQLKASVEQLKAGQPPASREAAKTSDKASELSKASEQNLRPKISALPPRPAAAHKPMPPLPLPQAAIARPLPATPYYVPRQVGSPPQPQVQPQAQPQVTEQQLTDPELASVPRPPMPLR
jgi:hypothetical protein